MVHGLGTGCMRQCALEPGRLAAGSRPGKEWAGDTGKRQCWENRGGTEEANEISGLRDLAARWGQASKGILHLHLVEWT